MFVATINQPGYLPDSDEPPPTFDTAEEAWAYLVDERKRFESEEEDYQELPSYTHAVDALRLLSEGDIAQVAMLYPAASSDFEYSLNSDLTGHIVAPSTLDPERHRLPYVYTVDRPADEQFKETW